MSGTRSLTTIPVSILTSSHIGQSSPVPKEAIPSEHLLLFDLCDGTTLAFNKTVVPNPPPVSFTNDITRLFKEWDKSDILIINGTGIAIRDWERFYKKRKGIKVHAWKSIGVKWGNWRFLAEERERYETEDAFWEKYSDQDGNRFGFQKILDELQRARMDDSDCDAEAALKFFNGDLTREDTLGVFWYRKGNNHYIVKKKSCIGKRWKALLCDHLEIAERWSTMCTNPEDHVDKHTGEDQDNDDKTTAPHLPSSELDNNVF